MSNSLDPDQARRFVGPDLGPNCLPRLTADVTGRQRVKPFKTPFTVKFLNFRTPENFAVINLKFKQRGQTLGHFVQRMQME